MEVTKPYTPNFSVRHPMLSNVAKSLSVGVSAGVATYYTHTSLNPESSAIGMRAFGVGVIAGSVTSLGIYAYRKVKGLPLLDALLSNPLYGLQEAYRVNDKFKEYAELNKLEEIKDPREERRSVEEAVRLFKKESPIFLLGECTQEGWGACLLSRTYQPRYRRLFEDAIVRVASEKIKQNRDQPLHYASFGCGGMFQDLVIITKILAQHPDAHIAVNLIDLKYTPYATLADFNRSRHAIEDFEEDAIDTGVMTQLIEHARTQWNAKGTDEEIGTSLKITCGELKIVSLQFIKWLRKTFPLATISMELHATGKEYLKCIERKEIEYPDIIMAVDIQDEMSLLHHSVRSYTNLCVQILKVNTFLENFWLAKKEYTVELRSFSLEEKKGAEEKDFKEEDDNITKIYLSSRTL